MGTILKECHLPVTPCYMMLANGTFFFLHRAEALNPQDGGSSTGTNGQELARICDLSSPCTAGKIAKSGPGQALEKAQDAEMQAVMLKDRKNLALAAVKEHLNPWWAHGCRTSCVAVNRFSALLRDS